MWEPRSLILDSLPHGRIFSFGDVHGCKDELRTLFDTLDKRNLTSEDLIVCTGDIPDRGPDTKGAIDAFIEFDKSTRAQVVCVCGNHCAWWRSFLSDTLPESSAFYLSGAYTEPTASSYGYLNSEYLDRDEIKLLVPDRHRQFFDNQIDYLRISELVVFVHAGLAPPVSGTRLSIEEFMAAQTCQFLHFYGSRTVKMAAAATSLVVVRGHVQYQEVNISGSVLNLDTGCYRGEGHALSCANITEGEVIRVDAVTRKVTVSSMRRPALD